MSSQTHGTRRCGQPVGGTPREFAARRGSGPGETETLAEPAPDFLILSCDEADRLREGLRDGSSTRTVREVEQHSIAVGRLGGRNGRPERHCFAARIFIITGGAGLIRLGGTIGDAEEVSPGEFLGKSDTHYIDYETRPLTSGMLVSVAAGTPYQLMAVGFDFAFIVVRLPVTRCS